MDMKRQISTATSDFRQLIEAGYLYVDKTRYVHQMVRESLQNYFFISRPRRYGKSLFCSTLEHLFKGERELFKGLYIAEETGYSFEKHPVLHFNFSLLNTSSFESFLFGFEDMIAEKAIESGIELEHNLPSYMLMEFLRRSEKASVIIIDEFDSPIIDSLDDKGKLERIRSEFSSFYSVIKNTGSKVRFLFITGVTKLSNMSIFSKMNNLTDVSMRAEYASAFGYTDEELEGSFKEYIDDYLSSEGCPYEEREELLSDIREYYDGYRFSVDTDIKVYNPVSVGMFFQNGCRFNNYWEMTGVSTLAVEMAKQYSLIDLMKDRIVVGMEAFTSFDISLLSEKTLRASSIYAFLYYTGYLTIQDGDTDALVLGFPNKEISRTFTYSLITRYMDISSDLGSMIHSVKRAMEEGDVPAFIEKLQEYYESFPYDLLYKDKERTYQLLFHAFFIASGMDAAAEDHCLRGRADNVIRTKSHIYVCELKVDGSAEDALAQIRERKYYEKYLPLAKKKNIKLHLVGMNFSSEERNIKDFKEEILQ